MFWVLRTIVLLPFLYVLYCAQRYWAVLCWERVSRTQPLALRRLLQATLIASLAALILPGVIWAIGGSRLVGNSLTTAASGLWLSSTFVAWLGVRAVAAVEKLWNRWKAGTSQPAENEAPALPSRRYFFQTASYLAGGVPVVGAFYGFLVERLHYRVERVEIPIPGLPAALDGLRIVQLSDIHCGGYMPRDQIRRAVQMANELEPHLAVTTGDFITGRTDPLEDCVEELAGLRAPLGAWGCNGNHEIYAGAQSRAASLFAQGGMNLLRQRSTELAWRGARLNLIGVDYQMNRDFNGRRVETPMLAAIEPLVRRDIPNLLLSHNPNAFVRAAELGIELTLAGHTHGGQVQVEILHERLNPARFMTPFISGLFSRPSAVLPAAHLYVNRGLGTIGTPVRIGSPPEITLITLRRA